MKPRTPPRLATAFLKRFGPPNDALAGDLREAYIGGKSAWWYYGQVITAMWFSTDRVVARRSIWYSLTAITAAVIVLESPFLPSLLRSADLSEGLLMVLYLMPQAIPIAIPVGIMVGTFYGLEQRALPRRTSPLLVIALLSCCVASFVISGWIIPVGNQAFRVTVAGRQVSRGAPELTLPELRAALMDDAVSTTEALPRSRRLVAVHYYGRVALSFAPLAFAMFAFSAASLLPRRRFLLAVGAGCAYLGYFRLPPLLMPLPPMVVAWLPNVALATVSLLIAGWVSLRRVPVNIK